jgi:hypothetical protein
MDNLTFNVAGASPSTITDIGITFTVDGILSYGSSNSTVTTNDMFTLGGGIIVYTFGNGPPTNTISQDAGWVSNQILSESPNNFVFDATYALQGASQTVPIEVFMNLNCDLLASCDFSNTGAVSLNLPSNVTYTSASGVFLTEPASTPEPGSGLMMLCGLSLVAFATIVPLNLRRSKKDDGLL